MSKIKNKKGIGWGKLFLIMCLLLFGLTIFLFGEAQRKVNVSIGTEELDKISSKNLDFYFFDSIRLATSNFINNSAQSSFIDVNNKNCQATPSKAIILDSDCKPDIELLKEKAINEIKTSINDSFKEINVESAISCIFEDENLNCHSNELELYATRDSEFISYVIKNNFVLNETMDFEKQLDIDELDDIYLKTQGCQDTSCFLSFSDWDVKSIEKEGDYLIFTLETKKEYPFDDQIEKILWKFAVKI